MITFPYAPLKVEKKVIKNQHDIVSLYEILKGISLYELGGRFSIKDKTVRFKVDKKYTCYNKKEDRPYVNMEIDSSCCFYWHSHPFSENNKYNNLSFPSIEDLDCARTSIENVFLLISEDAIFVYSYIRESTLTKLIEFYKMIESLQHENKKGNCLKEGWNYDILLKNFIKYKLTYHDMEEYDLFFYTIRLKEIDSKDLNKVLYKVIRDAYSIKEKSIKRKSISQYIGK